MSMLKRLILIVKGCLACASDRLERIAAEEELGTARRRADATGRADSTDTSQARSPRVEMGYVPISAAAPDDLAADYRLLGIGPGSDIETAESAWRRLAARADPKRFPSGSDEEKHAARILQKINESYARIREALNPTEGRFGRLEL